MNLAFVVMTWNRGGWRVTNLLSSLVAQDEQPAGIVLVDTSNDSSIAADVAARAADFDCRLIQIPRDHLYKSWALNVGIKEAAEIAEYIACTDIDFMFGPRAVTAILAAVGEDRFVMAEARRLPQEKPLASALEAYSNGTAFELWGTDSLTPGTIQCAHRDWWYRVRGYDERFARGLTGMDGNMMDRAILDGLWLRRLPFGDVQAVHQWHPKSEYKSSLNHLRRQGVSIVANYQGWGQR
jgi:glycosyltransferase involved in cell wall biosynthesis